MRDIQGHVLNAVRTQRKARKPRKYSAAAIEDTMMSVAEVCRARKMNPAEKIVEAIESQELSIKDKAELSKVLLEYVEPKKRSIEHSGSIGISLPELLAQAETKWRERSR